jgi:hypothetical protein
VEEKKTLRFKGTIILFVLSIIVGTGYFLYLMPALKEREMIEELNSRLFRINPEQVEFLKIKNPKGVFLIVKKDEGWMIKSPRELKTDSKTINKIMNIISSGRIVKIISEDIGRINEFGLDRPGAVLLTGYGNRSDELVLGGINPSGTGIYAYARGVNAIFLVDMDAGGLAGVGLYELRSKTLFDFIPETVSGIKIVREDSLIEMRKTGTDWEIVNPVSARASNEVISDFILTIQKQRADEFYDDTIPDPASYRESMKIYMYMDDNSTTEIDVHYWGTGVGQGSVVYQHGMKYSGRLPRDFWLFLDKDVSYFRYRNIFDFAENEVYAIKVIKGADAYEVRRDGDKWMYGDSVVSDEKMLDFIWKLKEWKAEKLYGLMQVADKEITLEIVLYDKDMNKAGRLKVFGRVEGVVLGYSTTEGETKLYYAVSDNLDGIIGISSIDLGDIPDSTELIK